MPYVGEQMQDHLFVPVAFSALKPVTMDKAVVEVRTDHHPISPSVSPRIFDLSAH
jgi:hypothetical protein